MGGRNKSEGHDDLPIGLTETALLGLKTTGLVLAPMLLAVGNHAKPFDGVSDAAVPEALKILREEFDLVNAYRAEALKDHLS